MKLLVDKALKLLKLKTFISENDRRCPVCLEFMIDPCQNKCGHRFCIVCATRINTELLPQSSKYPTIEYNDDEPLECAYYSKCPVCKAQLNLTNFYCKG